MEKVKGRRGGGTRRRRGGGGAGVQEEAMLFIDRLRYVPPFCPRLP